MTDQIKEKLAYLPEVPGIYKMLDRNGNIIYIGKSRCLKKRIKSYFVSSPKWEKVKKMIPFVHDIEFVVTDTHLEAMLLECELIKMVKPYFNVLMKYDERYVYLKVGDFDGKFPLSLVYKKEEDSFGPFRSRNILQNILEIMTKLYPITKINRSFLFEYHIFPITMNEQMFDENRKVLLELCRNPKSMVRFIREIQNKMKAASSEYKFETALLYRDFIENLSYLKRGLCCYEERLKQKILLDLEISQGHKLFYIAQGRIIHKKIVSINTRNEKDEFVNICNKLEKNIIYEIDEKASIDYRDIIYSELSVLSPDCIEIIS